MLEVQDLSGTFFRTVREVLILSGFLSETFGAWDSKFWLIYASSHEIISDLKSTDVFGKGLTLFQKGTEDRTKYPFKDFYNPSETKQNSRK